MKYKQNNLLLVLESFIYSCGQMLLGLLLHPYRSMQILVKNKPLLPFVFYPFLIGMVFFFLLKVDFVFSFYDSFFIFKFIYQVVMFYCFYWQLALFYLLIRFNKAFSKTQD